MEDLTKTQLVLLTLLISFVTSIGTGIITVTLLDEAPPEVTQTINRVVERTVERVVPDTTKPSVVTKEVTVVVKEEDLVIDAIEKNAKSIVRISGASDVFASIGVVVSSDGLVVADKGSVFPGVDYNATFDDKKILPLRVVGSDEKSGVAFLRVPDSQSSLALGYKFVSANFANSDIVKLGQSVIAIEGQTRNVVATGRISGLRTSEGSVEATSTSPVNITVIETDVISKASSSGSPLVNLNGEIVGLSTHQGDLLGSGIYIPANIIKKALSATVALTPQNNNP